MSKMGRIVDCRPAVVPLDVTAMHGAELDLPIQNVNTSDMVWLMVDHTFSLVKELATLSLGSSPVVGAFAGSYQFGRVTFLEGSAMIL